MKLKKASAALGLLSAAFMLLHMGYNVYAYLAFYYNPDLQMLLSVPFMVLVCIHAVLGMISAFVRGDGGSLDLYPRHNVRTILQRVSAALIFPLLILHLNTFSLLGGAAEGGNTIVIVLLLFAEVLFFACIVTHVATSFTNALITLGILSTREMQRRIDSIVYALGAVFFCAAAYAVVSGQAAMFLAGQV